MAHIDTLLLDFGNIIIDLDIPGATKKLQALRRKDITERVATDVLKKQVFAFEKGELSTDAFVEGILGIARTGVTRDEILDAWNSMLQGIPRYRLAMLESLKENYTVLLLSNTNTVHLEWTYGHLRQMHGVTDFDTQYFHGTYYSHLIGQRKPDREIFEHVIEDSFLTPENTLFIDDLPENLRTAKSMGFHTHLCPPDEEIAEYLKVKGYY